MQFILLVNNLKLISSSYLQYQRSTRHSDNGRLHAQLRQYGPRMPGQRLPTTVHQPAGVLRSAICRQRHRRTAMGGLGASAQPSVGEARCFTASLPARYVLRNLRRQSDQRRGYAKLLFPAAEKRRGRRPDLVRPQTGRHSGYLLPAGTVRQSPE